MSPDIPSKARHGTPPDHDLAGSLLARDRAWGGDGSGRCNGPRSRTLAEMARRSWAMYIFRRYDASGKGRSLSSPRHRSILTWALVPLNSSIASSSPAKRWLMECSMSSK